MKTWKYAVSTADEAPITAPIPLKGSICDTLVKASELGYDAIEVHTRPDAAIDYEAVQRAMEKTGVRIAAIITGRLNTEGMCSLIDDRPYVVDAAMKGMRQYVDMAAQLDSAIVLGWAKGNIPPGGDRKRYLDRLAVQLRILACYAAERHVKIMVEVINRYEVNIFRTATETLDFINSYDIDNLYIHLDSFHMGIEETDPVNAIKQCGKRLGYFHLADNTRMYPGSGQFDFTKLLRALKDIGYDGYLSVECLPLPNGEQAGVKALAYMKQIEQQL